MKSNGVSIERRAAAAGRAVTSTVRTAPAAATSWP